MKKSWCAAVVTSWALLSSVGAHADASNGSNVVNVVAKEMQFEMPDSIPAGPTLFHFTNAGDQLHHVTLVKLEQEKTLADFTALPEGPMPEWAVFFGGPNTPMPQGGTDEVAVDLVPGNYAVVCVIPDSDGAPHMVKGMAKALTVTPSSKQAALPKADVTLTLDDYVFNLSVPLTPGKRIIEIVNASDQPHEAEIFQMSPGKTGTDMARWVEEGMQGPPPGAPVAGITPMSPGKKNVLFLDLKAGNYALLCFMPDAKDGKLHVAHGMIFDFKV